MNTSVARLGPTPPIRDQVSDEEWNLRVELAAAHRLLAHNGINDLTYNHISARVPGEPNCFLIKSERLLMEQVAASNLVKYDLDGNKVIETEHSCSKAGFNIHVSVLTARPDINGVIHTHTPANVAVSCQKHGLLPISQQACRFHNRIAYHANDGKDAVREGTDAIAETLGDKWTMILENHGALICGASLPEAFVYHHFFELACKIQIAALAGGGELIHMSEELAEERATKAGKHGHIDSDHRDWVASMLLAEALDPSFRE